MGLSSCQSTTFTGPPCPFFSTRKRRGTDPQGSVTSLHRKQNERELMGASCTATTYLWAGLVCLVVHFWGSATIPDNYGASVHLKSNKRKEGFSRPMYSFSYFFLTCFCSLPSFRNKSVPPKKTYMHTQEDSSPRQERLKGRLQQIYIYILYTLFHTVFFIIIYGY